MRVFRLSCVLSLVVLIANSAFALQTPEVADIDQEATHEQIGLIEIPKTSKVNAFCLDDKGRILAACGSGPGEIRVLNAEGEELAVYEVEIMPEAINTAPDGTILVAGQGKVLRLSSEGKLLKEADSPHAIALEENKESLRQQAEANLRQTGPSAAEIIKSYQQMMEQLEEKKKTTELNEQEERILTILPQEIEKFEEQLKVEEEKTDGGISEEAISQQIKQIMQSKLHVASISSDGKAVYVATPAATGYTFEVWKMSPEFSNGEVVVSDLRGCCGHMDVQACEKGVYVAENARHRVACFGTDGSITNTWGKADRTGKDGFTSCCNPMNVCFDKTGDVYTAESNTGRIKRFAADGTFKEFVGDVKLVPGCKNVSIAISPDNNRVYMLDITRNHIVLMQRKATAETATDAAAIDSSAR